MAIDDFADMMPHTIIHNEFASRDAYGVKIYGSDAPYSARVTYKDDMVRDKQGNEVPARGQVWILGIPRIDPEDQITLPDGTTPPILNTSLISDELGSHHTKISFG